MKQKESQKKVWEIRQKIKEKFGWSIREWAKRRGFSYQVVYFAIKGDRKHAGGKRMKEVLQKIELDLTE